MPSEPATDGPAGVPLVIIPTFNERESLPEVVARLRRSVPAAHVLVADDASPDGTGRWADAAAAGDDHIHVLHRGAKRGLGKAYLAGFAWGLGRGFDPLVEMDADGSHRPEQLPALLAALDGYDGYDGDGDGDGGDGGDGGADGQGGQGGRARTAKASASGKTAAPAAGPGADLAIGSRWVKGGEVVNWPKRRQWLSRGGNLYVSIMLGLGVKDATAGFRAYRASLLRSLSLDAIQAQGYAFQVDMTRAARRAGARIVEVPISFPEREAGVSKMNGAIVREAMWLVTKWGLARWWAALTGPGPRPRRRTGGMAGGRPL